MSTALTDKSDPKQPKAKKPKKDTRKVAAKTAGVSERQIRQAQEVKKAAPEGKGGEPPKHAQFRPGHGVGMGEND